MPKTLGRAEMDLINNNVEIALSESKRIPVIYQGALYYLYSADMIGVQLESVFALHVRTPETDVLDTFIEFEPETLLTVPATDPAIHHFLATCAKNALFSYVPVRFAELADGNMRIQLQDQPLPFTATERYYTFIEDHYELLPN